MIEWKVLSNPTIDRDRSKDFFYLDNNLQMRLTSYGKSYFSDINPEKPLTPKLILELEQLYNYE